MRLLFFFTFAFLLGGQAVAQDTPPVGSTIKGSMSVGRSTFALPPGEWRVVATNSNAVVVNGISRGSPTAIVYVAQLDAKGTFIAALSARAPLSTSAVGSWTDTLCDRKDTLYRDAFSGRFDFPECLLINHIVSFQVTAPNEEFDRKIWDWYRANNVKLPTTVLVASYRKYFSGDYVSVAALVNPEYFGQNPSTKTVWAESEWHPAVIKNDPKRLAFVEGFKKWSYIMADNAKTTLMDRKPKSASLPALDELGGPPARTTSTLGKDVPPKPVEERLTELKTLMEKGLITKEQYDEKRAEIVKSL